VITISIARLPYYSFNHLSRGKYLRFHQLLLELLRHRNEDDAPNGWNYLSDHANILLLNILLSQDLQAVETAPSRCWICSRSMLRLDSTVCHFSPHLQHRDGFGEYLATKKLRSTVRRLRMNRLDQLAFMDVTADIALGGNFSTTLGGPVPANLVVLVAAAIVPLPGPGASFARPVDSRPGSASSPANFLM
jgi:hypothetical protein